jgi:CubicO group peptidase (beta-lactamase class C family)
MIGHVEKAVTSAIESGQHIGIQIAAYKDGRQVIDVVGGLADPDTGRRVDANTLFNVFSVAKAVTATALHVQAERGLVDYDERISTYWPEFARAGKESATVRHALTHCAGVPQMPDGVTVQKMCDWDGMCRDIAALDPMFAIGSQQSYHAMTFGWIIGEIVTRTDPARRSLNQYVQDEICAPLGIADLWLGTPDSEFPRIAKLTNANAGDPPPPPESVTAKAMPAAVSLTPETMERPEVRRATVAGVGGIFTARSEARFWAVLAGGGQLDGVRLLSEDRVRSFLRASPLAGQTDPVLKGELPISSGGYWLGSDHTRTQTVGNPRALCHPGAGGSIGWADPDNNVAVAICLNRMYNCKSREDDTVLPIAIAVREALGQA